MNIVLIYFAIKYNGDFKKIFSALKNHEEIPEKELEEINNKIENKEINAITLLDENYPNSFKRLYHPPFVVFYESNINLLSSEFMINLTGEKNNQNIDDYLNQSLPEVAKNYTLISCLENEIDERINDYFIKNNKKVIYVSDRSIKEKISKNQIKINENNLIISEFPEKAKFSNKKMKSRNLLVASLAERMIIYSSRKDSDLLKKMVSGFLEKDKNVYCFPGNFDELDGNADFIKQGMNLITKIKNDN